MLDWYDFGIFAFFSNAISHNFFAQDGRNTGLFLTFLIFGCGFTARPIGGLIIGRIGDRISRRTALIVSIIVMGGGTLGLAVLPGRSTIGEAAPFLLLIARLMQGLAAGGEWGGAATFIVEAAPLGKRGLYGGIHEVSAILGPVLALGVASMVASIYSAEAINSWAWRLPFLIGALLIPVGFYCRLRIMETPVPHADVAEEVRMVHDVTGPFFRAFSLVAPIFAVFYTLFYFPTLTQTYLGLSARASLWANTAACIGMMSVILPAAVLSDRVGRRPMTICAYILIALATPVLFWEIAHTTSVAGVTIIELLYALAAGLLAGPFPATLCELFPARSRLTGIALAYNVAGALFGGFTPLILTATINYFHTVTVACAVSVFSVILGLAVMLKAKETAFTSLP
ncbi:MFS transporter [Gluconacetobacter azotocaptans]|uniref:MFS transporter n=1 Tax=Gluconacetobacter azotocaptans TaxID=142834 RepID=A0A7W4PFQ1_9PROT|nr:MFS transporter [Gluconacetobacter azotocaptans]MBM9400740.1 MFS transporter [Gluconacetobacter azotocaptans]